MRKKLCALMMTLSLLAGCGGGEDEGTGADELALNIRTEFLAMTACSFTADITADYGQRGDEYTLEVAWEKDGETVLTVTAPETIAGITARIADGTTYLEYDGASLETGPLSGDGLSPMEAVPAILEEICTGCIAACGFETVGEQELLRVVCREPESTPGTGAEGVFWFDPVTHAPVLAELMQDGYTVIRCEVTEFTKE